jgi:hypothetical protein
MNVFHQLLCVVFKQPNEFQQVNPNINYFFFSIGMDRIEPCLFGCSHLNHKIVDSFMTNKKLVENCYKIKLEYKSLI